MKLERLHIQNFRAHRDTELPLSDFGCLIGENNAGKSSVLHALHFGLKGAPPNRLEASDFNNQEKPIRIELTLTEITPNDLARIEDEANRSSVKNVVDGNKLTLVRTASLGTKASLQILRPEPKDERWSLMALNAAMKGKSGVELRAAAVACIPELDSILDPKPTQTVIREERSKLISGLPPEEFELRETPPPTGIEAAMRAFLPEVIYIEAVKDVASEAKTSDSATFGKLLKILLDEVADQFGELEQAFANVQRKLSRLQGSGGEEEDLRLDEVKQIESTIERLVQESFPDVSLKMDVPAPELRTILSSAELRIDDGHEGPISNKGDGLKRTVAFAILRAYTSLRDGGLSQDSSASKPRPSYLLLFEEPELYLHPRAQRQLFDALARFSADHPVIVTTHSPLFFSAESTSTFVKLRRTSTSEGGTSLVCALPVNLRGHMSARDAFQIICHENNEAALFARTVVLVEGDSDVVVFPHLSKLLNSSWDPVEKNIVFIKTGGKTSIARYREFFRRFEIEVHAIADLDAIIDGFQHLTGSEEAKAAREALMMEIGSHVSGDNLEAASGKKVRNVAKSGEMRSLWQNAEKALIEWSQTPSHELANTISDNLGSFFDRVRSNEKMNVLRGGNPMVMKLLDEVLDALRADGVHVLRRGDLEAYYGRERNSDDKVRAAVEFCTCTSTLQDFRNRHGSDADAVEFELRKLLAPIFDVESVQDSL